jgi:hypothetical protein
VGDDPCHDVAAAVVLAEDLGEEAPEGRDRVEDPVAVRDAVLVEGVVDAGFGQDSANGRPSLRAKRARSRWRLVLGSAGASEGGTIAITSVG